MGRCWSVRSTTSLLERLKARAREHGRSAEAEARAILAEALAAPAQPRSLMSLVGAGSSKHSFRTAEDIVAHVRARAKRGSGRWGVHLSTLIRTC